MKNLFIVSKALRRKFNESLPYKTYQFIALFNFFINMSVEVKI